MKSLSRVRLFATPWTAAYQAPAPMGFSRQEYWSGLPLPSPAFGSATTKSLQSCPTLCDPIDGSPPSSSVHGIFQQEYWSGVPLPSPRQILYIYKSAKPPGKPKNTGVGTLSLLQRIFPTQESNRALPHYRRILYQLSHQGSPLRRTHCNSVLCDVLSTLTNGTE